MTRIMALVLAAAVAGGPLAAQNPQFTTKGAGGTSERTRAVDQVALARQLAEFGVSARMPIALVTAARILMDTPATRGDEVAQQRVRAGAEVAPGTRMAITIPELDPVGLLSAAYDLSGDDPQLRGLIGEMRGRLGGTRGATGGPVVRYGRVNVGYYNWYTIRFNGGEQARVVVDGDGTSDLDCFAYAEDGSLVDSDVDYTDYCVLSWWENWTGMIRIEVHNVGNVYNDYVLMTN